MFYNKGSVISGLDQCLTCSFGLPDDMCSIWEVVRASLESTNYLKRM